jgi:phosphoribosylanthranilate isomerase
MRPKTKICGITNWDDAIFCTSAGADAIGFIFYQKSQRYVEPSRAARIIEQLPRAITPVGVFANEPRKSIEHIISETGIRLIQLSGDESPEDCTGFSVSVWKAFRFRTIKEMDNLGRYEVEAVLLDGARNGSYGGSGMLPDFQIAREMKKFHPLILAGGLNPDNVLNAVRIVEPWGIDVNSGIELIPGKKDHTKVRQLFEQLSALENSLR